MQIDVTAVNAFKNLVACNLYTGDRCVKIYMSHTDYRELIRDGFFIRDGKTTDSADVINTTFTYEKVDNRRKSCRNDAENPVFERQKQVYKQQV